METIFCLGAAIPVPSFPTGPNASRRATRLQGAAMPVACALGPAYLTRGRVAAPLPWSTKPAVRSSTRTAAGGGGGNPGSIEDLLKRRRGHNQKDGGGGKDVEAEKVRELRTGEKQLPPIEALTAILPLEKRFQLLELLNQLALAQKNEEEIVTKSHVSSKDWLSSDEKLAVGFALTLVHLKTEEYAKAKQVLEKLLGHQASTDASRVPMAALTAVMLALEMHLKKARDLEQPKTSRILNLEEDKGFNL